MTDDPVDATLDRRTRAVIERLAAIERPPASEGEARAAKLLADELAARGGRVRIEQVRVHGTYWIPIGLTSAVAAIAAAGGRLVSAGLGALCAAAVADDLELGRRPLRRLLAQRPARNVIAEFGEERAERVLVIHAHHDAARTGLVFDPAIAKFAARTAGGLMEKAGGTPVPMWGAVAGPALVAIGGLLGRSRIRRLGGLLSAGHAAAMADIARRPAVAGANDNLSGVAVLLALADELARRPPARLRVLLLSTGSEESFLEAMERFGERHFTELPGATFLCIESVGSPQLMLLSGEGLLRLHRYPADLIRDLTQLAKSEGIPLRQPFKYRLATDGQVPLRAGRPAAAISSMDWYKAPSNYHWHTDRPENLDLVSVRRAAALAHAFVRRLEQRADDCFARADRGRPSP